MKTNYTCTCKHELSAHNDYGECTDRNDNNDDLACECRGYTPLAGRREINVTPYRPDSVSMSAGGEHMEDDQGRPVTFVQVAYLLDLLDEITDRGGMTIVRAEKEFGSIDLDQNALGIAGFAFIDTAGTASTRVENAIRGYLWALANVQTLPGFGNTAPSYAQLKSAMARAKDTNR